MKTIAFLICGMICFAVITWMLIVGHITMLLWGILCLAGIVLVGVVLRVKIHPLHTTFKLIEED